MNRDKDIKFPEKKVDSSWKEQISKDRISAPIPLAEGSVSSGKATSVAFMNFLKSLATQALMSLGEIPNPMTGQSEVDLATAKEMIDLLILLKQKTAGNCSAEESAIFNSFLPELQLKFSNQA
jgi:hypothetical protein